jgi:hypothetical protein
MLAYICFEYVGKLYSKQLASFIVQKRMQNQGTLDMVAQNFKAPPRQSLDSPWSSVV